MIMYMALLCACSSAEDIIIIYNKIKDNCIIILLIISIFYNIYAVMAISYLSHSYRAVHMMLILATQRL